MKLRVTIAIVAAIGLVVIFLFQQWDLAGSLGLGSTNTAKFLLNRSARFILNDTLAIILIHALFANRRYTLFAIYVQLVGMVFILFPYFAIKMYHPSYNGPLINFMHRFILNPMLLLLLIPALYYQCKSQGKC